MMPKPLTIDDFLEAAQYPDRVRSYLHNLHGFENEHTRVHTPHSRYVRRTKSGWWHVTGEHRAGLTGELLSPALSVVDLTTLTLPAAPPPVAPAMSLAEFAKLVIPYLERLPVYMEKLLTLLEKMDQSPSTGGRLSANRTGS